jgi:hypothetical protein
VLNVAVSVFVDPDVAPGTIPDTQSLVVFHKPLGADELQVPLAAVANCTSQQHNRASQIPVQAGRTRGRPKSRIAIANQFELLI